VNALDFHEVSKAYAIYDGAGDRLKELALLGRKSLHRDYWAIRNVSFTVPAGETLCIIGENGAGKSTLLQLVAGILHPTAGSIHTNGNVATLLELGSGFNPEFTGRENVYLSSAILGQTTAETDAKYRQIEEFAEIGEFIDRPTKTYSSGMVVRLAFSVAIHTDPDILLLDEALSIGDLYFRQRSMRKIHELQAAGATILFVSHSLADVRSLGDRTLWLDRGTLRALGDTESVVGAYLEAMALKDASYENANPPADGEIAPAQLMPPAQITNVDHRFGDGRAFIAGLSVLGPDARPIRALEPSTRVIVRIAVHAPCAIQRPVVGFTLRNHLGIDFSSTNTHREGHELPPLAARQNCVVDFHLDLPELYPAFFSLSPGIADGTFEPAAMCDWIDNAVTMQMTGGPGNVYGYVRLPCRIEFNHSGPASHVAEVTRD